MEFGLRIPYVTAKTTYNNDFELDVKSYVCFEYPSDNGPSLDLIVKYS